MRLIFMFGLISLFGGHVMTAAFNPAWNDTPVPRWTEQDAKHFLADSPWVKTVKLDKVRNLSEFERRDGGNWEAGIPSGIGIATLGLFADWRDIEALEHAFAVAQLPIVTVRWESASPIRAAEVRAGETGIPNWTGNYYAIAVYNLSPPFHWNLANQLKGVAFLKREKQKDLKPSRVLVVPQAGGLATFVYLFPRAEITKKDRSLGFTAQIGRLFIFADFKPEEMRLEGQLEL